MIDHDAKTGRTMIHIHPSDPREYYVEALTELHRKGLMDAAKYLCQTMPPREGISGILIALDWILCLHGCCLELIHFVKGFTGTGEDGLEHVGTIEEFIDICAYVESEEFKYSPIEPQEYGPLAMRMGRSSFRLRGDSIIEKKLGWTLATGLQVVGSNWWATYNGFSWVFNTIPKRPEDPWPLCKEVVFRSRIDYMVRPVIREEENG